MSAPDLGTRNDLALTFSVVVEVVPKVWTSGTALAHDKANVENGRITAPQDQRKPVAEWENQPVKVAKGATIALALETASDWDAWTQGERSGVGEDKVTYQWSVDAPGQPFTGTFSSATSNLTNWTAPQETGDYFLKCTINDQPLDLEAGESGNRNDDPPVVRTIRIQVVGAPSLKFSGVELTEAGLLRACAGGVDDREKDDPQFRAHVRNVTATLTPNGQLAPINVQFKFTDNKGHNYGNNAPPLTARLYDAGNAEHWPEELTLNMADPTERTLSVKSSDVINKPTLEAHWTNAEGEDILIGSLNCEFGQVERLRRFIPHDDEGKPLIDPTERDTGWIFDFPQLNGPNNTTPAKVYFKFNKDLALGDVDGNWNYVNGHQITIKIDSVDLQDGSTSTLNLDDYAVVLDPNHITGENPNQEGKRDGAAQATVQAQDKIDDVETLWVRADDQTQWDE